MGKFQPGHNAKHERNAQIYADYKAGANVNDIANLYHISSVRVYQIIKKYRKFVSFDISMNLGTLNLGIYK